MTLKPYQEFDSFYDLVVDVIENDPDVTQKSLAGALGQSTNAISRKLKRENISFRLDELPVILAHGYNLPRPAATRDYRLNYLRLLYYLADLVNCMVVEKPCAELQNPADFSMGEMMERFGHLSSRYVRARSVDSPGGHGLTRSEKDELVTLGCEMQRRAAELTMAVLAEEEVE